MAAYAFTRFQLRIMAVFLGLILVSQMFPSSAITLPVATWMLKGFMENIPSVLDEAAAMDGAKRMRTFLEIVLPLYPSNLKMLVSARIKWLSDKAPI
jgi:multiple sugar transport system permease protein/raffinose/stachyose/melibiose transport system permease protein